MNLLRLGHQRKCCGAFLLLGGLTTVFVVSCSRSEAQPQVRLSAGTGTEQIADRLTRLWLVRAINDEDLGSFFDSDLIGRIVASHQLDAEHVLGSYMVRRFTSRGDRNAILTESTAVLTDNLAVFEKQPDLLKKQQADRMVMLNQTKMLRAEQTFFRANTMSWGRDKEIGSPAPLLGLVAKFGSLLTPELARTVVDIKRIEAEVWTTQAQGAVDRAELLLHAALTEEKIELIADVIAGLKKSNRSEFTAAVQGVRNRFLKVLQDDPASTKTLERQILIEQQTETQQLRQARLSSVTRIERLK